MRRRKAPKRRFVLFTNDEAAMAVAICAGLDPDDYEQQARAVIEKAKAAVEHNQANDRQEQG